MKVNGNERAVSAEETVLALLKELGHDPQRVADILRLKLQFQSRGDISAFYAVCPKEICASQAAHKFLTGMKTEIHASGFHGNCNAIPD